jgi:hypothetical protein
MNQKFCYVKAKKKRCFIWVRSKRTKHISKSERRLHSFWHVQLGVVTFGLAALLFILIPSDYNVTSYLATRLKVAY